MMAMLLRLCCCWVDGVDVELEHGGGIVKLQLGSLVDALLDHAGQLLCHGLIFRGWEGGRTGTPESKDHGLKHSKNNYLIYLQNDHHNF